MSNSGIWSVSASGEMAVAYPCTLNWGNCIGTLALVPPAGGAPREILDNVSGADWAPDGKTLAVAQLAGERTRIIQYPGEKLLYEAPGWVTGIRVSPKADRIAFLEHPISGDVGGSVIVLDLTGKKNVWSSGWKALIGLAWSPNGDQVWFTGSRETKGGGFSLFAATASGTERRVHSTPSSVQILDISRDGGRVLIRRLTPRSVLMGLPAGDRKSVNFPGLIFRPPRICLLTAKRCSSMNGVLGSAETKPYISAKTMAQIRRGLETESPWRSHPMASRH